MNGFNDDLTPYNIEYTDNFPFSDAVPVFTSSTLPSPMIIPGNDYGGSNSMMAMKPELGYCSSACSSYGSPSAMSSYVAENMSFLQRSTSSMSLQKSVDSFYPFVSSPTAYNTESDSDSARKVFSRGDLQQGTNKVQRNYQSESSLSNEASIIECMTKAACKYSPEEKKEKIERYRNKRNLRNFNKKIKYECRKTLADSRPRIRGRFARNDEIIEKTPPQSDQWGILAGGEYEEEYEYDDNFLNLLDVYSANYVP
ncbi:hypothetical protein LIER_29663 [Lithospermum erythrorhizon]|uniref:CCT domain-containing protein n=1 Tax=Lithospermum erythrorhizon TaxID=34254 RepID=A0AAV3RJW7_LITER